MATSSSEMMNKLLDIQNIEKNTEEVMRFFDAGGNFEQLLGMTEAEMTSRYAYAFNLFDRGVYKDALEIFSYLTVLNPMKKKYWLAIAATRVRMEDYEGALKSYAMISLLDPNDPESYYYSAFCYLALQYKGEAVKSLKLTIEVSQRSERHRELGKQAELALQHL
jgi:type III secretion system low calcium response chaperone LcrH/SycD